MENVTNWYDAVPYADIKNIIRDRVTAMAREYIGIGFFLRKVRDNEMYLEDGYKDIHDFAMNEFGMRLKALSIGLKAFSILHGACLH